MSDFESNDVYAWIADLTSSDDLEDQIVAAIWRDVTDRRGWRQEHDQFPPDIQMEIVHTWRRIVREVMAGTHPQ